MNKDLVCKSPEEGRGFSFQEQKDTSYRCPADTRGRGTGKRELKTAKDQSM